MKKLLPSFFMAILFGLTSCNECNDVNCENGAICYEGECQCAPGFGGDNCEIEYRELFVGAYILSGELVADSTQYIQIVKDQTKGDRVLIQNFGQRDIIIQAYIVEDEIYFDQQSWGPDYTIEGFGNEINGQINLSVTIEGPFGYQSNIIATKVN